MIKRIIKQYQKYKPMIATKHLCYNLFNRQQKKTFGNLFTNEMFYVIRPINSRSPFYTGVSLHLLANYFYVLSHIKYAQQNNWIPIIDQQHYHVYNSVCCKTLQIPNAWEIFWNQPSNYTLDDVYRSKNVVLSKRNWFGEWDMGYEISNYTNKDVIEFYNQLSKSVTLKSHIIKHIDNVQSSLFNPDERILGVSIRYGGYAKHSYHHGPGHPVAPEIEILVKVALEKFNEWNMQRVFLASDEENSIRCFQKVFGKELIVLPRKRTDSSTIYNVNNINPLYSEEHIYNTTLSYLTEMELLAKCKGIIGSITSGLRYAIVQNNNAYEFVTILDCGKFPDPSQRKTSKVI